MSRRVAVFAAALVAGVALLGFTTAPAAPVALCDTDASCAALGGEPGYGVAASDGPVFVAEDHTVPAVWECLRGLGYVGSPLDGVEALYVPQSDLDDCTR